MTDIKLEDLRVGQMVTLKAVKVIKLEEHHTRFLVCLELPSGDYNWHEPSDIASIIPEPLAVGDWVKWGDLDPCQIIFINDGKAWIRSHGFDGVIALENLTRTDPPK